MEMQFDREPIGEAISIIQLAISSVFAISSPQTLSS
jgi:hypothetical protein